MEKTWVKIVKGTKLMNREICNKELKEKVLIEAIGYSLNHLSYSDKINIKCGDVEECREDGTNYIQKINHLDIDLKLHDIINCYKLCHKDYTEDDVVKGVLKAVEALNKKDESNERYGELTKTLQSGLLEEKKRFKGFSGYIAREVLNNIVDFLYPTDYKYRISWSITDSCREGDNIKLRLNFKFTEWIMKNDPGAKGGEPSQMSEGNRYKTGKKIYRDYNGEYIGCAKWF